jgi:hypothetical protein
LNPKQRIDDHIAFRIDQTARDLHGQLGEISTRLDSVAERLGHVETVVTPGEDAARRLSAEIDVLQERIAGLVEVVTDRMLKLERAVTQLQRDIAQGDPAGGSPP